MKKMNTRFLTPTEQCKEPNDTRKKSLKEEIMNEISEIVMEKLQGMVKQKVQDELKQYQDFTNKLEKTQKQLNELREDFAKC
jgi:hypothetical protein